MIPKICVPFSFPLTISSTKQASNSFFFSSPFTFWFLLQTQVTDNDSLKRNFPWKHLSTDSAKNVHTHTHTQSWLTLPQSFFSTRQTHKIFRIKQWNLFFRWVEHERGQRRRISIWKHGDNICGSCLSSCDEEPVLGGRKKLFYYSFIFLL